MHRPNPVHILGGALICVMLCVFAPFKSNLWGAQANSQQSVTASAAPFGNCPAPSTAGVKVCLPLPGGISSPMQVIASGTGSGGPVVNMQLFIDGKKVSQMSGNLFDLPIVLATGTHRLVVVEVDSTGHSIKSTPMSVTVQGSTSNIACDAPGSPGVQVCMPSPGSCQVANYTTIVASGTSATGTVRRMELWVNGVKLYYGNGNTLNTNLALPANTRIVIQEVDSNGVVHKAAPAFVEPC